VVLENILKTFSTDYIPSTIQADCFACCRINAFYVFCWCFKTFKTVMIIYMLKILNTKINNCHHLKICLYQIFNIKLMLGCFCPLCFLQFFFELFDSFFFNCYEVFTINGDSNTKCQFVIKNWLWPMEFLKHKYNKFTNGNKNYAISRIYRYIHVFYLHR
jgi:hypothetical protein